MVKSQSTELGRIFPRLRGGDADGYLNLRSLEYKMKTTFAKFGILTCSFALLNSSCGEEFGQKKTKVEQVNTDPSAGGDDNASGEAPGFGTNEPPPSNSPFKEVFGVWEGPCVEGDDGLADKTFYLFSENAWVQQTSIYDGGTDCDPNAVSASNQIRGRVQYSTLEDASEGSFAWDGSVESYLRAFHRLDIIDNVNDMNLHGYSDWQLDKAKECIGRPDNQNNVLRPQTVFALVGLNEEGQLLVTRASQQAGDRELDIGAAIYVMDKVGN